MALVDPNIALSYKGVQLQDPLEQYGRITNIQSAQQAQQMNALQMDKFMRDRDALKQIQAAIISKGGPPDLEAAANEMIRSGIPEYMQQGIAIRQKVQETKAWENYEKRFLSPKTQPTAEPTAAPAVAPTTSSASVSRSPFQINMLENRQNLPLNRLMPSVEAPTAPTPKVSKAPVAVSQQQRILDLEEEINMLSAIDTPKAKARQQVLLKQLDAALKPESNRPLALSPGQRLYSPTGEVLATAPDKPQQPRNPIAVLKDGKPILVDPASAVGQTPLTPPAVQILGLNPRDAKEPPAPSVTQIQDPTNASQMLTIDARTYKGGGVGSPGVIGLAGKTPGSAPGLSDKDRQKRDAEYPKATQSVKSFETKSDLFIRDLERLRDDPGLNQITGPIYGRTPSVSQAGSRAQALYDKIFAKGGFQALQDMREASKTGGALGNVSNEEGRRLERSVVGGLDRTQNIKDVRRGINDLIDEIRTSKSRVREAYESTYDYRTQQGAAPSPAPASGGWSVVR